ncbi:hypothetical protein [Nostoc sp.]|uniref:hypothetical protein n=1 Tax=Nostoc sp. TaxID=1180 RepID=UPI002FFA87F9
MGLTSSLQLYQLAIAQLRASPFGDRQKGTAYYHHVQSVLIAHQCHNHNFQFHLLPL